MAGELTSYNSVLSYSTTQGGSYTNLAKAKLIKLPKWTKGTVNVRGLTDLYPSRLPGWIDYDETLKIELYLTKALFTTLQTMFKIAPGGVLYWWKMTFQQLSTETVAASYFGGEGFLKTIDLSQMEVEDNMAVMLPCEIEASGEWTFTGGS